MKFRIIGLSVLFFGCSTSSNHFTWTDKSVAGLNISLEDTNRIYDLSFSSDHYVAATFGQKDGYIAGPLLYWKINEPWLTLFEEKNPEKVFNRFRVVSYLDGHLVLETGAGDRLTFKILNNEAH